MSAIFPATSMPDRDWWAALWPDPASLLLSLGVSPGMT
ncbi:methyltransferase, partial [Mesorhizobium sp. M7A.F.Ca.US.001.04.1.1]